MSPEFEVFIGWDPRERLAWQVCARSILSRCELPPPIAPISLSSLHGLYDRPTGRHEGVLIDGISQAPMATEFSLARFWVPFVSRAQWALFVDGDFLFRGDVRELFALADPRYAVQVVKHDHQPGEMVKMDGQPQSAYARKNWSSCVLWNLRHAGARRLTLHEANHRHGLWLHQFSWLRDHEIGELPLAWNWLEGVSDAAVDPQAVHFTRGTPDMPGYEASAYADEWRALLTLEERRAQGASLCVPDSCATR